MENKEILIKCSEKATQEELEEIVESIINFVDAPILSISIIQHKGKEHGK